MADETWHVVVDEGSGGGSDAGAASGSGTTPNPDAGSADQFFKQLIGVSSLAALAITAIHRSKIFSTFMDAFLTVLGVLVDILFIPLIPVFVPVLLGLVSMIPHVMKFAKEMAPIVQSFMDALAQVFKDGKINFEPLLKWGQEFIIGTLIPAVVNFITWLTGVFTENFPKFIAAFVTILPEVLKAAIEIFSAILKAFVTIMPVIVQAVVEMLPKVIEAIKEAFKQIRELWPQIKASLVDLWVVIKEALPEMWALIKEALGALWSIIKTSTNELWPMICTAAKDLWELIGKDVWKWLNDNVIQKVVAWFKDDLIPIVWKFIQGIWATIDETIITPIKNWVTTFLTMTLPTMLNTLITTTIPQFFQNMFDQLLPKLLAKLAGAAVDKSAVGVIGNGVVGLMDAIMGTKTQSMGSALSDLLGGNKPLNLTQGMSGKMPWDNAGMPATPNITLNVDKIYGEFDKMFNDIAGSIKGSFV